MLQTEQVAVVTTILVMVVCMATWQFAKWRSQWKYKPYMDMLSALVASGFHPDQRSIEFWTKQAEGFGKAFNSLRPIPEAWSKEKRQAEQSARDVYGLYLNSMRGHVNKLNYHEKLVEATGLYNEMASGTLKPSQLRTKSNLLTDAMNAGSFGFSAVHSGLGGLAEFFDDCVAKYLASQAALGCEGESDI